MNGWDGGVFEAWGRAEGRKEESNWRRPDRSATMILGLMYVTNPLAMIPVVNRMSRMEGVVVKTMQLWVTFLETWTQ